jgi:hypothetical protein
VQQRRRPAESRAYVVHCSGRSCNSADSGDSGGASFRSRLRAARSHARLLPPSWQPFPATPAGAIAPGRSCPHAPALPPPCRRLLGQRLLHARAAAHLPGPARRLLCRAALPADAEQHGRRASQAHAPGPSPGSKRGQLEAVAQLQGAARVTVLEDSDSLDTEGNPSLVVLPPEYEPVEYVVQSEEMLEGLEGVDAQHRWAAPASAAPAPAGRCTAATAAQGRLRRQHDAAGTASTAAAFPAAGRRSTPFRVLAAGSQGGACVRRRYPAGVAQQLEVPGTRLIVDTEELELVGEGLPIIHGVSTRGWRRACCGGGRDAALAGHGRREHGWLVVAGLEELARVWVVMGAAHCHPGWARMQRRPPPVPAACLQW